jgi:hypothetical protein
MGGSARGNLNESVPRTSVSNFLNSNRRPFHELVCGSVLSGREDLNLRLLAPHASALAGLRYAPIILLKRADYSAFNPF